MTNPSIISPLAERVLTRIHTEKVVPRARWTFILANYIFWILGGVAVFLGALAFAAATFEAANAGWRSASAAEPARPLRFLFEVAPYLWALALLLFTLLEYVTIRHTRRGYRYPLGILALGAIVASLALGSVLYALGFGRTLACFVHAPPEIETAVALERSDICKGIRPYTRLR